MSNGTCFRIVVGVAIAAAALGCSSPTRPSVLPSRAVPSAASQAPGASVCSAFTGAARGLCHALFATGCVMAGPTPESCGRLVDSLVEVTGTQPSFLFRRYVSLDVEACQFIRFNCSPDQAFFDDSGCGCEPIP